MKNISPTHFYGRLKNKKYHFPLTGELELTYRCGLNCIYCYCKGSEDKNRELTIGEWKKILDAIQKEGCLFLTFTGGSPLIRDDFLDLYAYAKKKGFIITLFTNGQGFTDEIVDYLVKSPPFSIDITLNGISKDTYEAITQIEGSFSEIIKTIKILAEKKIKVILKTNCLKQNKYEIGKIKKWAEKLLGKPLENKHHFRYDPMILPRLNGDKTPCDFRLSFEELLEVKKPDADIWQEYQKCLHGDFPDLERDRNFLYRCDSWMSQFFIDPFGRLKFCEFSEKFSIDLKTTFFKEGFYNWPSQILNQRFKTDSKCRDCRLRPICYHCPVKAYLETGDEEAPVPYYCDLANATEQEMLRKK